MCLINLCRHTQYGWYSIQRGQKKKKHLNSNPLFENPPNIWFFCVLYVFLNPCVLVQVHVHQCRHECVWHWRCAYGVQNLCACVPLINSRKLIQFIAFTYWPEPFLQGGIMADWVCMKTGRRGSIEERVENITKYGDVSTRSHYRKQNQTTGICINQENWNHVAGFFFRCTYEHILPLRGVIWYRMSPQNWFSLLAGMIK